MTWDERTKSERKAIRREMLKQSEIALAGLHTGAQLKAAARTMVDMAIARERKGESCR